MRNIDTLSGIDSDTPVYMYNATLPPDNTAKQRRDCAGCTSYQGVVFEMLGYFANPWVNPFTLQPDFTVIVARFAPT